MTMKRFNDDICVERSSHKGPPDKSTETTIQPLKKTNGHLINPTNHLVLALYLCSVNAYYVPIQYQTQNRWDFFSGIIFKNLNDNNPQLQILLNYFDVFKFSIKILVI